jgi:3-hydroxyisobutyrate dehydrogenase-like beta-hydroxyacid dehydrogenase
MKPSIAIIAPGNMGAAVGRRLVQNGLDVATTLEGRSAASRKRANEAGLKDVDLDGIASADMLLSILPPGEAVALARMMAPRLRSKGSRTLYVDCNAVSPKTVRSVGAILARTSIAFVDAGIIGGPPRDDDNGPNIYASGPEAKRFAALSDYGLAIRVLEGPIGAASALKMCYAGINKGVTGLAAAMLLAASREGAVCALHAELSESQAPLLTRLRRALPDMYPKSYRWVAEMEEISQFLTGDEAAAKMFEGLAKLYARIAADFASDKVETAALDAFLAMKESSPLSGSATRSGGGSRPRVRR